MNRKYDTKYVNRNAKANERRLAFLLGNSRKMHWRIASSLEWVITWKIKSISQGNPLWCDGFEKLKIKCIEKRLYSVQGLSRIGLESDVANVELIPFSGHI